MKKKFVIQSVQSLKFYKTGFPRWTTEFIEAKIYETEKEANDAIIKLDCLPKVAAFIQPIYTNIQ